MVTLGGRLYMLFVEVFQDRELFKTVELYLEGGLEMTGCSEVTLEEGAA